MKKIAIIVALLILSITSSYAEVFVSGWWNATLEDLLRARKALILEEKTNLNTKIPILQDKWWESEDKVILNSIEQIEREIKARGGSWEDNLTELASTNEVQVVNQSSDLNDMRQSQQMYSFQKDYDGIEKATNSIFFVGLFDNKMELFATGSGFVAFDEHYFVTNYHVIEGADRIAVMDENDNLYFLGRVLAKNEELDLAILEFEEGHKYDSLKLRAKADLKRGQPVTTIGSPEGFQNTVAFGNISGFPKFNEQKYIQFTAPISHGSSGGCLFDDEGYVIGITTLGLLKGENIGLAIPVDALQEMHEKVGVKNITPEPQKEVSTYKPKGTSYPVGLKVSIVENTDTWIKLEWDPIEYAESYEIQMKSDGKWQKILSTKTNTCKISKSTKSGKRDIAVFPIMYGKKYALYKTITFDFGGVEILTPQPTIKPAQKATPTSKPSSTPISLTFNYSLHSSRSGYISKNSVNVRKEADQSSDKIDTLEKNTKVTIVNETYDKKRVKWYKIRYNGKTGFVRGDLITIDGKPITSAEQDKTKTDLLAPKVQAISFDDRAEWRESGDILSIRFRMKAGSKDVSAFELYVYATDVWGEKIYGKDMVYYATTEKSIKAGKTAYSDYINIPNRRHIHNVYCGIKRVMLKDGTKKEYPLNANDYYYWTIK